MINCESPFIVGLFCGISKPKSMFEYLNTFVKDLTHLLSNGIIHSGRKFQIMVSSFVCDAPARAFVKNIKAFDIIICIFAVWGSPGSYCICGQEEVYWPQDCLLRQ